MLILNGKISLSPLLNAQSQLNQALATAQTRLEITGSVKCFEYCYELSWKIMRRIIFENTAIELNTPRTVFAAAFKNNLITDLDAWNSFIEKRNLTVHTYDGQLADIVFEALPHFADHLEIFIQAVKRM